MYAYKPKPNSNSIVIYKSTIQSANNIKWFFQGNSVNIMFIAEAYYLEKCVVVSN